MNIKFLKDNLQFIVICFSVVVLGIVISIFLGTDANKKLTEKDNAESGEPSVNKLIINEIMSSNKGTLSDEEGNLYDWVELYNGNNHDINLKNYGLSDDRSKIKWVFPDTTIKAKSYLIIYLCGEKKQGLYANFKLSSAGGETLVLTKANGKILDAISVTPLEKNETIARDLNGNLYTSKTPTPGYANTKEGYLQYIESLTKEENKIKINEVLPRNKGNFQDANNNFTGYIELINISNESINLKTFSLSNSSITPFKYKLPDVTLKKGEVYVLYTSTSSTLDNYTGFKLIEKEGEVVLSNQNKIVDILKYENISNGIALIYENGNYYESNNISPGYANTNTGVAKFNENTKEVNDLIINEVMNENNQYLAQNGGQYYDFIELKNNSNTTINLKDYYLTTSDNIKDMYNLPDVTLKKDEYYILMASGDTNLSNNSYKHTNFKVSETEGIYLYKKNKIIDSIFVANVPLGYSIGKNSNKGTYYFSNPTPGKTNGKGVTSIAYMPELSEPAGIYNNIENISITMKGNGTLYYTLDGSKPTKSSKKYTGPIFLTKTTVLKVINYEDNKLPSEVITSSYIINENHTIPVLSISLNNSDFNKINTNTYNSVDPEVATYAELFEKDTNFSISCGLKLFGGTTRGLPKKSYQLKFKSKYGASQLHYQVFKNRDFSAYDSLVLRSASTDYEHAAFADIFMTSTLEDLDTVEVQAYKTIILYINGKYWGIYNIREKIESEFIANHYNVSEDKVNITRIDYNVTCGSTTWYRDIVNYVSNNDMANSKNYEYIKTQIDIDSLIDFWIAETYTTNNDIVNARFYSHPDISDGKLRSIFYDLDWAMFNVTKNYYIFSTSTSPMSRLQVSTALLRNLMKNNEFKQRYVERLSYNLNNIWTYEKLSKKLEELYQIYKKEMPRNAERWDLSMDNWEDNVNRLRNYIKKRTPIMLNQTKSFFGLTNEEMNKYFGDLL